MEVVSQDFGGKVLFCREPRHPSGIPQRQGVGDTLAGFLNSAVGVVQIVKVHRVIIDGIEQRVQGVARTQAPAGHRD